MNLSKVIKDLYYSVDDYNSENVDSVVAID